MFVSARSIKNDWMSDPVSRTVTEKIAVKAIRQRSKVGTWIFSPKRLSIRRIISYELKEQYWSDLFAV